ncbi:ribonuclease H-like domain-containing protein [Tanacetum coccineum]
MTQKLGNGFEFIKKACFVYGSFNHLIKDCDFHNKKVVEKPVLNNKGRVTSQREVRPVWNNAQRQSSPRAAASISTARPINTAAPKPKVNDALPTTYSYFKAHSPVKRAFKQKSATKIYNLNEKVKTARVNNVTTVRPKAVVSAAVGNGENVVKHTQVSNGLGPQEKLILSFLVQDYQEIDGEFVAFRGSPKGGKIIEKGKIRTGKLDFEDVYFVKELKFNLFSVSQMCDKKNNVLFTKTECLVISPDFKLTDESQFCGMKGIKREFSVARTPQQNRVAERKNRTLNRDLMGRLCLEDSWLITLLNSKAFRVFNTRTRKVKENLHITFLENKPNVAGSRPDWLFDIDLLTNSMNYEAIFFMPILNSTNKWGNAGIKDNVDAVRTQQYILLPLLSDSPQSSKDAVADDAGKKTTEEPANEGERNGQEKEGGASNKGGDQNVQDLRAELDKLLVQQKEAYANNTNRVSTISLSVRTARKSFINVNDLLTDPLMPDLEDTTNLLNTSIFSVVHKD